MKKFIIVILSLFPFLTNISMEYTVSVQNGSDENDGTKEKPFRTIGKAAKIAKAGDIVIVRAGIYRETIVPVNSGTKESPITFKAMDGEEVTITGTEEIKGWTLHKGRIYKANIPLLFFDTSHNQAMQVFVDGQMMNIARWPNSTLDPSLPAKSIITRFISKSKKDEHIANGNWTFGVVEDNKLPFDNNEIKGAKIFFQPNFGAWSWAFTGTVEECKNKILKFKTRSQSGKDFSQNIYDQKSRYYLYGHMELLDTEGEWFYDEVGNSTLYIWLPGGNDPNEHRIEVKKREFAFDLTEKSNIIISGFKIFAATITTDRDSGGNNLGYDGSGKTIYPWRGANLIAPSENIVLENLEILYPTYFEDRSGHFFLQWGQSSGVVLSGTNHILRNSIIKYSSGNGVSCIGKNNKIINNFISDVNFGAVDCSAISTGGAAITEGHEFSYNTIQRCGRSGITPRRGNNKSDKPVAWIHHNDISMFGMQDWDHGGIYTVGNCGFARWNHNLIHDVWPNVDNIPNVGNYTASGLYPDFGRNLIMDHNVIWNVEWGIHIQNVDGGSGNKEKENASNYIIANNTILVKGLSNPLPQYGPFGIVSNSRAKHIGTIIVNNIIACINKSPKYVPIDSGNAERKNNLLWDAMIGSETDPMFLDVENFILQLSEGSPAIDFGISLPDLQLDGVKISSPTKIFNGKNPDAGAFEYGEEWNAGCSLSIKNIK